MIRDTTPTVAFFAVVEHHSFTKAAAAIGVPKSTVSRWISELERRCGVKLLDRSSRHLTPTEAGRALFNQANQGVATIRAALRQAADANASGGGAVRITATPDLGELILGPILERFAASHDHVRIEAIFDRAVVNLVAEQVDIAVRVGPLLDSSLVAKKVGMVGRRLVASPAYLARRGKPSRPEDLRGHDCLSLGGTQGEAHWRFGRAGRLSLALKPRLITGNMNVLKAWALDGLGIGFLSSIACASEVKSGKLVSVLEHHLPRSMEPLYVVHARPRFIPARVRALLDFVIDELERAFRSRELSP